MDRHGIAVQVVGISEPGLGISDPGVGLLGGQAGRALSRDCNELGAELISTHPDRFGVLGLLLLPDVEGAR